MVNFQNCNHIYYKTSRISNSFLLQLKIEIRRVIAIIINLKLNNCLAKLIIKLEK